MWVFKILYVLARNQLFLKPVARRAVRALRQEIRSLGFQPRSVQLWLGLAEAEKLSVMVFFRLASDLSHFNKSDHATLVQMHFTENLARTSYPSSAVQQVKVRFFSHEEIMRGGGYFYYFK